MIRTRRMTTAVKQQIKPVLGFEYSTKLCCSCGRLRLRFGLGGEGEWKENVYRLFTVAVVVSSEIPNESRRKFNRNREEVEDLKDIEWYYVC